MTIDAFAFLERYPQFNGVDDNIIDSIILEQSLKTPPIVWKNQVLRDKAIGLLTAHVLRLEYGDQLRVGGALRSIEEGEEVKIDLIDLSLPYYKQTIYGQEYLQLRKSIVGMSMFVV